jgi:transcriptional regulator with XRE-family HTH domain
VRHLRTTRGWTQDDFARRMTAAGHTMHQTTVAKLELGMRPTGVDEITDIAAIFGVQPAALFEELGQEQELMQQWRELRARLIDIVEERSRLRSRLETLKAEYKSNAAEYHRLGRLLHQEVNDIG